MTETQQVSISKEMGISHREFFRILPRVMDGLEYRMDGGRIEVDQPTRHLEILVSDEEERKLGALMSTPVTKVQLTFTGYSSPDRAAFLAHFEINFFRGGG